MGVMHLFLMKAFRNRWGEFISANNFTVGLSNLLILFLITQPPSYELI